MRAGRCFREIPLSTGKLVLKENFKNVLLLRSFFRQRLAYVYFNLSQSISATNHTFLILVSLFLRKAMIARTDLWLAEWTNEEEKYLTRNVSHEVGYYFKFCGLLFLSCLLTLLLWKLDQGILFLLTIRAICMRLSHKNKRNVDSA